MDVKEPRYRPDEKNINTVESLLKELKSVNTPFVNQENKRCPVIHKILKRYVRHYVGFINRNKDKVIRVNFVWKSGTDKKDSLKILKLFRMGVAIIGTLKLILAKKNCMVFLLTAKLKNRDIMRSSLAFLNVISLYPRVLAIGY